MWKNISDCRKYRYKKLLGIRSIYFNAYIVSHKLRIENNFEFSYKNNKKRNAKSKIVL